MCKPNKTLKFCSCSNSLKINTDFIEDIEQLYHSKKEEAHQALKDGRYLETYHKWTIKRYTEQFSYMAGRIIGTQQVLSNGFTDEYICNLLNHVTPFDFDYKPIDKDVIVVEECYTFMDLKLKQTRPSLSETRAMNFSFEDGQWTIDGYAYSMVYNDINKGKLNTILPTEQGVFTLISKQKELHIWTIQKGNIFATVESAQGEPTIHQRHFIENLEENTNRMANRIKNQFSDELLEIRILESLKSWDEFTISHVKLLTDFNKSSKWNISFKSPEFTIIFHIENDIINTHYNMEE